jgi:hypothetical protein
VKRVRVDLLSAVREQACTWVTASTLALLFVTKGVDFKKYAMLVMYVSFKKLLCKQQRLEVNSVEGSEELRPRNLQEP